MTATFTIVMIFAFSMTSAAVLVIALLERCERHLRALHVKALGPSMTFQERAGPLGLPSWAFTL